MWPAISAVLRAPGIALPRYQNACCQTGSSRGPSGASMASSFPIPTPSTGALISSFGISRSSGTLTGPPRRSRPFAVSDAGTKGAGSGWGFAPVVCVVVGALVGGTRVGETRVGETGRALPPHAVSAVSIVATSAIVAVPPARATRVIDATGRSGRSARRDDARAYVVLGP